MVISQEDLLRDIPDLRAPVIGAIALFVLLAVIRGVRLARTFSEPMEGLVHQGERMQRLNFQPSEPVRSNIVEIRMLAETLERMRQALYSFSSVREDIRIAHSIRRAILPAPLPTAPGFEIEAWSEPSSEVGGEAYDVVDFWVNPQTTGRTPGPPDGIALFIFDAAGLGVNTAVKGSQLRAIFRTGVRLGVELPVLAEQMNHYLRNDAPDSGPVRSWYGQLKRSNSQLASLCLGQEPVLQYIAAEQRFEHLDTPSSSLGFEDRVSITPVRSVRLAHGDIVVIVSDGVVDTMSPAREKFGVERIKEVIMDHQQGDGKQILEQLRQALTDFASGSAADEDRTIVLIKCS
jgi:phosphoserine phosphatase RsbU/P